MAQKEKHRNPRPACSGGSAGGWNAKIESFGYHGRRITNFEMEGSALAGLAALMGHRAATICTIIAQRIAQNVDTDYKPFVRKMISTALDKLAVLK